MAQLTIADDEPRVQYTVGSTASTGPFAIPFEFFNTNDIKVVVTDRTTLIDTQLSAHPSGFTVTATAVDDGFLKDGSLTLASAVTNSFVTIYLVLDLTRTTNFPLSGAFDIASLNTQLSRVFASLKQQSLTLARTIQFGRSDSTNSFKIPADRANKVLSFDADKNLTATNAVGVNRGNWAAGTAYDIRDIVKDTTTNNIFMSNAVHTSSGALPLTSNADAAKWDLIVDAATSTTAQTNASSSASAAASSATAANTSKVAAETAKTASETAKAAAETAKAAAETAETNSANSATAAANSATQSANEVAVVAPKFTFSTTTTVGDPGTGIIRFNNSNASLTTIVLIDIQTADTGNPNIADWLKTFDDSTSTVKGYLRLHDPGTPQNFVVFNITSLTDSTTHIQFGVSHVDSNFASGTTFGDAVSLRMSHGRTGDLGATGATGAQGSQGIQGVQGPAGPAGAQGVQGPAGPTGPTGPAGPAGSGSGDIVGPSSATDNALARFDATTGKLLQDSNAVLSDAGILSATGLTLTNDLSVGNGGTGASSFTAHGVLIGNTASALNVTAVGTSGQVLTSNGSGSDPTFQTISGGGPALDGGGTGEESVIRTNKNQISGSVSLTVAAGSNGISAGPITITSGSSVTVASGATWHIVGAGA